MGYVREKLRNWVWRFVSSCHHVMNIPSTKLIITMGITLFIPGINFHVRVVLNFGVCFRSINRSFLSPSSLASRCGHYNILNLRQNLSIYSLVYGSLDLGTNVTHHLVHFPRYSRVQLARQPVDLNLRVHIC